MPVCPMCKTEVREDELLEGVGPCWLCKQQVDELDFEEERKFFEEGA